MGESIVGWIVLTGPEIHRLSDHCHWHVRCYQQLSLLLHCHNAAVAVLTLLPLLLPASAATDCGTADSTPKTQPAACTNGHADAYCQLPVRWVLCVMCHVPCAFGYRCMPIWGEGCFGFVVCVYNGRREEKNQSHLGP